MFEAVKIYVANMTCKAGLNILFEKLKVGLQSINNPL